MNLNDYEMFVDGKTSSHSKNFEEMIERLNELHTVSEETGVQLPQLITASQGLPAEAGEFAEIVKKMLWQGKPLDEENKIHLKKELGDLMFYAMMACTALGCTLDEIIDMNVAKLNNRYEKGFTVVESEERAEDDI